MPDEVNLLAVVEATIFAFYFTTSVSVHFSFQESVTQKCVFGNYTSLVDSKKHIFKVSLNAQYNFSVRLHEVKTWFCLPVEDDGENLFSPWSKILDRATLGLWEQVFEC
jgi:hypothetical protein